MGTERNIYTLQVVVSEPQEVEMGELNKSNGLPQGPTLKAQSVLGVLTIPNYSKVWGKPVLDKDKKRTGEITFMPFNTKGGEIVEIRYLPNCPHLDKVYQDEKGFKMSDEDGELFLQTGLNNFDSDSDLGLIEMLKHHTLNGDSPCRNPKNERILFVNYDESKIANTALKKAEDEYLAVGKIMEVKDNSRKLAVYAEVFNIETNQQDRVILKELLAHVKLSPEKFLEDVGKFQHHARIIANRAADLQVLDFTKPGEIHINDSKLPPLKLPLNLDLEKRIEYIGENIFEPEVYDFLNQMKDAVTKKESELN